MSADVISIVALAAIFAIAIFMSVNMGLLAFAAAFLVGTLAADMTADDIFGVFPGDIFVVLVGITYLFAIAQRNGTVDWLVNLAMRAVGGRVGAIPGSCSPSPESSRRSARSARRRSRSSRRSPLGSPSSSASIRC
jgi:di/tricarboxylate transporter